jgi:hypothetical protein
VKGLVNVNVNTPVPVGGFTVVGVNTTVEGDASNVLVKAVAAVFPIFIWKFGSPPPDPAVKLNPMLVKLPGANPAAVNSAAVYNNCVLAALPPPARNGEPPWVVVLADPTGAVPVTAEILVAVSVELPPTQMVVADAVTLLINGFGFTVIVIVAVFVQPVTGTPSFAVNT